MIVQTKTGVRVSGTLSKDPEFKQMGGKDVLKLSVKASSEKDSSGKWNSLFVDVLCWNGLNERDGMYQKGDYIEAEGREIKRREYPEGSGKFYYNLNADGIIQGDLVTLRWMQQAIDILSQPPAGSPQDAEVLPTSEPTPFESASDRPPDAAHPQPVQITLEGAQMYPGERLSDYAPPGQRAAPSEQDSELERRIAETDAEDLPF